MEIVNYLLNDCAARKDAKAVCLYRLKIFENVNISLLPYRILSHPVLICAVIVLDLKKKKNRIRFENMKCDCQSLWAETATLIISNVVLCHI